MTRWVPFLGLAVVVLILLLALARLSSTVVRDGEPDRSSCHDGLGEPTGQSPETAHSAGAPVAGEPEQPTHPPTAAGSAVPPAAEPPGDTALDNSPSTHPAPEAAPKTADTPAMEPVELSAGLLLANVALTQGLIGLVIVAGLWWFEIPGAAIGITADPWVAGLPAVGLGLAFGAVLWLGNEAVAGIADAVGAGYDEAMRSMLAPDSVVGWAVLLALVLPTIAVVEEVLFRAALIGVPAAGLGISPWLLAIGSSVVFALGHGAQGRVGIAVTGVLGFVLAAGYVISGSLLVVIVAHYLVNTLEFVVHEALGIDRIIDT